MPLGRDLENFINSKIVYMKVDDKANVLTIKFDFESVGKFFEATKVRDKWKGSQAELEWGKNLLYSNVKELDKTRPLKVKYIEYKDSVFDSRGVVVVLISFEQELSDAGIPSSNISPSS